MLPQIELLLPELDPKAAYAPLTPKQIIDSGDFAASFADLLGAPILAGPADIEFPEGKLLPEYGNALPLVDVQLDRLPLPAPPIETHQRITPQQSALKRGLPVQAVPLRRPDVPRIHAEISHAAQSSAHRQAGLVGVTDLAIRPDKGMRNWQISAQANSQKSAAPASPDTSLSGAPLENANSPLRRLTGLPVELPDMPVPPPSAKPEAASQGVQYTGATAELVMSRSTKIDTVPTADPRRELVELRAPTDGYKPTVERTTPAPAATVAGNTPIATASVSAIQTPVPTQGASVAQVPPSQVVTKINIPVLDAQWGTALNERVTWMAGNNVQNAEIRLNPAELGPLRVQVSISEGSAQVVFDALHAVTREAIESALPRLREMLSENGLQLTDVNVSDQEAHHGQAGVERESTSEMNSADAAIADGEDQSVPADVHTRVKSGLVDTFV